MTVLVTGAAGFIGSQVCLGLLNRGEDVVGVDNLNDYYSVQLKRDRLALLTGRAGFTFHHGSVGSFADSSSAERALQGQPVIHLAAQAGVRHGLKDPGSYVQSNLVDFWNALDFARRISSRHFLYASSSSVYGANKHLPFSESDEVNHPVSLYAATKRSNELMTESYSHLYGLPATGVRLFTVYGPWGRPDMAIFDFTRRILNGDPIPIFAGGHLTRDFTYVDDVVSGILACLARPPMGSATGDSLVNKGSSPHMVLNLGCGTEVTVAAMVDALEEALGIPAHRDYQPAQPGDVAHTLSSIDAARDWCGYEPTVSVTEGISQFVTWYRDYFVPTGRQ